MTTALAIAGGVLSGWLIVAYLLGRLIGSAIHAADVAERTDPSHP